MFVEARKTRAINQVDRLFAWTSTTPHRGNGNDVASRVARLSVEQFPHGLMILGEGRTVLGANRQAETIFAYPAGEMIGLPISLLLPEQSRFAHAELWNDFRKPPESGRMGSDRTVGGLRKDGAIVPLEVGLSVLVEGRSRYLVASIVDITERLNLEARLDAATNERLGFQRLIGDIAARFGSVEPDTVDEAIVDSLRHIGEALRLDVAIFWRKSSGDTNVVPTHYWVRPPHPSPPESLPIASIPFVISKLEAHEDYWFSTPDEVPDHVDRDQGVAQDRRELVNRPVDRLQLD